ncbi:hypothetical protein ABH922_003776 [Rhodococcus sp. 27YEA15]|uniref:hypothetical protein n=1 Tax=Rhodococcus sp. 27YEA15 TaxID=3156259 RepID=UPI003C7DFC21
MIASVWLWSRGQVDDRGGSAIGFGYCAGTFVIPVAFVVASLIEALAVHLLVPWEWLRWVLLVATTLSIVLLVGTLATRVVHPHLVTERELILRSGSTVVATVDRSDIESVRMARRFDRTQKVVADDRLFLPGPDGTVLDIDFRRAVSVRVGAGGPKAVVGVSLHVDDPRALLAELTAV